MVFQNVNNSRIKLSDDVLANVDCTKVIPNISVVKESLLFYEIRRLLQRAEY